MTRILVYTGTYHHGVQYTPTVEIDKPFKTITEKDILQALHKRFLSITGWKDISDSRRRG